MGADPCLPDTPLAGLEFAQSTDMTRHTEGQEQAMHAALKGGPHRSIYWGPAEAPPFEKFSRCKGRSLSPGM